MNCSIVVRRQGIDALTKSLEDMQAVTARRDEPDGSTVLSCSAGGSKLTLSFVQPPHWKERPETENLFSVAILSDFWRIFKRGIDRDFMNRIVAILQPYQWKA